MHKIGLFVGVKQLVGLMGGVLWAQMLYTPPWRGWQVMEVGPVMIWYISGQEGLARQAGQWGADIYRELVGLLEFQPEAKLVIQLHPSPYSWALSPVQTPTGMLLPPPTTVGVYPLPSRAATAALIRSEVTTFLLQQLYFSEGVRVQNRSLLYLPDWFFRGFAYFWGEGWTGEDLARLEDVPMQAFSELSRRTITPSPFYKSLYKSIWFYLYRAYGQRKVIDLLYMTRLTRSINEALYLTLNLSEEELWEKWRDFLQTLRREGISADEEIEKRALLTAAVARDGETRAFAVLREDRIRYFLRLNDQLYELPGDWKWRPGYDDPPVSMSFSPGGSLVWTAYEREGLILWRWNTAEKKYERHPLSLLTVQGLSWESENLLLFSGMGADGQVRIYSLTFPQGTLRVVEEARGDLLYPQRFRGELYALWQPDTSLLSPLAVLWEPWRPVRRSGTQWQALSYPPFYSAGGGWITHDTALTTISDITGSGHPWTFTRDTSFPVRWTQGAVWSWAGSSDEGAFFLRYRAGKLRLVRGERSTLLQEGNAFPPIRAAEAVQLRLQRRASYMAAYAVPESAPADIPSDTTRMDTARSRRQPFYLFDEDTGRPVRRKSRSRLPVEASTARRRTLPTPRAMGRVPYHWNLWEFRLEPVLHPLMRFGWQVSATARDWQGDHAWRFFWRPYIDLRSSELQLSYTRYRSHISPVVELYKQSHFFPARRYNQTLRITTWQGRLGARYPLSPYLTVGGYLSATFADRYHIGRPGERDLSESQRMTGIQLHVKYERLTDREGFTWSGWRSTLRGELLRAQNQWSYPLAFLQVERFQPALERIVFQIRGTAAAGGTRGRYFLLGGIPEWINYEFQNRAQVPLLTDPVGYFLTEYAFLPGFPYQARRGRNLLLGSIIAHMPLLAWRREPSLPTRPVYTFDWHIGYYIGTTWTTGNPFSQKNPIDADFIFRPPLVISVQTLKSPFLMSFGTGLTFQIMKLPLSADLYWPLEEGRIGRATFLAGIRREF